MAYDAISGFERGDVSTNSGARLDYLRIVCLARSGAAERAEDAIRALAEDVAGLTPDVAEDNAALHGRLAKDRPLALTSDARHRAAAIAARLYQQVYEQFGRSYVCINAATLWLLASDVNSAESLARQAIELVRDSPASSPRRRLLGSRNRGLKLP